MEDIKRRAIEGFRSLLEAREPRREIMWALMGNSIGILVVPDQVGKVYCRLYGDVNQIVKAWCHTVDPVSDRRVDVEVLREPGQPDDYYVIGLSRVGYGGYDDKDPPDWGRKHGPTHERRPGATPGSDIVNIYKRAFTELRADAQETPDMTVHVRAGFYLTTEIEYFTGANSPAFAAAPGGSQERYDLLYLDTDTDALTIRQGTAAPIGIAIRPQPQENEVPGAWVRFTTETEVADSMIIDARIMLVTMGAWGLVTTHPLDPTTGPHTGALAEGDVSFDDVAGHDHQGEGDTGKRIDYDNLVNVWDRHVHAYKEDKSGECDGVKVTFITAQQFEPYTLRVFHERLEQVDEMVDYAEGAMYDHFDMVAAPNPGDKLVVHYLAQLV